MKTIQLRTEIPGPNSRALLARREAAIPRGPSNATPVFAARAEGAVIEDVDGNRYIDFAGGIGCLNAGHRSPRVVSALREQLEKHLHLCFAVTPYEGYVAVAEKLNALAPGNFSATATRSEEHTSELQSLRHLVCRLLLEKKKKTNITVMGNKTTPSIARATETLTTS